MKITDDMLFECAAEARDIWLSTLPADEEIPDIPTSRAFERKMQKLIKEQRRTPRTNVVLRCIKQTVAAVLAVAILSFGGLMTVEAYREKVIEIVVHVFHELTDYHFASDKMEAEEIVLPEITFEYIPDGMQETKNRTTGTNRRFIVYEGKNNEFFELSLRPIASDGGYVSILDTEESTYEVFAINGNEAFSNEKGVNRIVVWTVDNIVYRLYGNVQMDELKAVAEKIRITMK